MQLSRGPAARKDSATIGGAFGPDAVGGRGGCIEVLRVSRAGAGLHPRDGPGPRHSLAIQPLGFYLNHLLHHFPDRLASAEWQSRCRITGLEHWWKARQNGRPVVLAYCHFGPSFLLREWLRGGLPVAPLVRGSSAERTKAKWLKNRHALLPEVPTAFFWDQLRELSRFLADGNVLLIAIDHEELRVYRVAGGRRLDVSHGHRRDPARRSSPGGIDPLLDHRRRRLALSHRTRPACRRKRFDRRNHWAAAGKQLLQELLAQFRIQPSQCTKKLVERFRSLVPSAGAE